MRRDRQARGRKFRLSGKAFPTLKTIAMAQNRALYCLELLIHMIQQSDKVTILY